MAVPIAMRTPMEDASQPILPPRQTSRMQASGTAAPPATWKSWPVVVIGIAVVAIIVAVILMVWPPGAATKADAKTLAPPPAPERMDTNPTPSTPSPGPSGQADPWKTDPGAAPDPAPSQPHAQPSVPDIDDIQPPNLSDPFRGRGGGLNSQATLGLMSAIMKHTCDRLASCPNATDPTVKMMCDAGRLAVPNTPPPTCSAAQRCLSKIDALPCDDLDPSATLGMIQGVQDCIEAMSC